ncbi:hypothetical protein [Streptomyces albus]|uniref:hypothetical protein n=1 Tax=Streptomyces albus TaxID=1888 RepID=UPI003F4CC0C3
MGAVFGDTSVVEDVGVVGAGGCGEPVSDQHDRGAVAGQGTQPLEGVIPARGSSALVGPKRFISCLLRSVRC